MILILLAFILWFKQKMLIVCSLNLFQTVHEGRIYQLKLFCDKDYPEKPPSVRFHTRIKMTCVSHETGVVMLSLISTFYEVNQLFVLAIYVLILDLGYSLLLVLCLAYLRLINVQNATDFVKSM